MIYGWSCTKYNKTVLWNLLVQYIFLQERADSQDGEIILEEAIEGLHHVPEVPDTTTSVSFDNKGVTAKSDPDVEKSVSNDITKSENKCGERPESVNSTISGLNSSSNDSTNSKSKLTYVRKSVRNRKRVVSCQPMVTDY